MSIEKPLLQKYSDKNKSGAKKLLILAIETSCDETAISILSHEKGTPVILSNEVSSQVKLHAKWGGVVPNLAARQHVKNIDQILKTALTDANVLPTDIDIISVTNGPGLIPALLVGVSYAKTLSYLWEKPLIGIHHIEGHIYANFIGNADTKLRNEFESTNKSLDSKIQNLKQIQKIKEGSSSLIENLKLKIKNSNAIFPALALVVSGGHTQLVLMRDHLQYEIIGQTVDDAVGEAFDKVARILEIGYPGGPAVADWAAKHKIWSMGHAAEIQNSNDQISNDQKNTAHKIQDTKYKIRLPRPMLNKKNFDFSFSGLKTAVLYETKKNPQLLKDEKYIAEICHEFQQACVDVLIAKTMKAAEKHAPKTILLAGGVSANTELRRQLGNAIEKNLPGVAYSIPEMSLTGDNAAMIGAAAAFRWKKMTEIQKKSALENWKILQPNANLKMK